VTSFSNTPNLLANALADVIAGVVPLTLRYVGGFDGVTALGQLPGLPNHVIWTLGHCGYTAARVASHLSGQPIEPQWYSQVPSTQSEGFEIATICRGSTPVGVAEAYPPLERATAIFREGHETFERVIRGLSGEELISEMEWHDGPIRLDALIRRIAFHTACHAGQLIDLRRGFNLPPVLSSQ
jgi:hypothetical protein